MVEEEGKPTFELEAVKYNSYIFIEIVAPNCGLVDQGSNVGVRVLCPQENELRLEVQVAQELINLGGQ